MSENNITFEVCNTKLIPEDTVIDMHRIEQDMWAREQWLWEYLKCTSCDTVYSKQDIFWSLPKNIYNRTTYELEQQSSYRNVFYCKQCWWENVHFFWREQHIEEILWRYKHEAVLVLMKKGTELIGFMDGYVADFDTIYDRELEHHYVSVGRELVKSKVITTLDGNIPDQLFTCSSSGTKEWYMNFFHIYNLLKYFFQAFPNDIATLTAISELNAGGAYDQVFSSIGAQSIGMVEFQSWIQATEVYNSDIFVHRELWKKWQELFSQSLRSFILQLRWK